MTTEDPTYEELKAAYIELRESNRNLANMLANASNRLEESRRELLATGWDEGIQRAVDAGLNSLARDACLADNPHRKPFEFGDQS